MEHILQTRLTRYLENNNLFLSCIFGFRPGLSTQDVFLQLQNHILDSPVGDTKAILAVYLTKAFDNVTRAAVLEGLLTLGVRQRMYSYNRDFLSQRAATLTLGDNRLSRVPLGARGTPQGAVLSPMLFNITLLQLPNHLSQVPDIRFSFYADDITVWANRGSDADMEHNLQSALKIIDSRCRARGLACSPSKSELFLYCPRRHDPVNLSLTIGNHPIPLVSKIRILGLLLHSHGAHGDTIQDHHTKPNKPPVSFGAWHTGARVY
ncbi:uncharacterized protein LOC119435411 [Dermacentor silvarum]|uniref:uncharacterized protein LOC119435411 n=1 Tax=Dermacentor silvarum TaxID=543639 RepID=UPI0018998EDD|nr:uncharacterized protein LOC119435411 [Dermacentor silvarum]